MTVSTAKKQKFSFVKPWLDRCSTIDEKIARDKAKKPTQPVSADAKPQLPDITPGIRGIRNLERLLGSGSEEDYRKEVILAMIENYLTIAEASQMFEIAESTIKKWLIYYNDIGMTYDQQLERQEVGKRSWHQAFGKYLKADGDLDISDQDYKRIRRKLDKELKEYSQEQGIPYAYERDFSPASQIARRGTEETPTVDYIIPLPIFKRIMKSARSGDIGVFYDPETSDIDPADLVLVGGLKFEKEGLYRSYYVHRKTGDRYWNNSKSDHPNDMVLIPLDELLNHNKSNDSDDMEPIPLDEILNLS